MEFSYAPDKRSAGLKRELETLFYSSLVVPESLL
jgi:hypothetical protein